MGPLAFRPARVVIISALAKALIVHKLRIWEGTLPPEFYEETGKDNAQSLAERRRSDGTTHPRNRLVEDSPRSNGILVASVEDDGDVCVDEPISTAALVGTTALPDL